MEAPYRIVLRPPSTAAEGVSRPEPSVEATEVSRLELEERLVAIPGVRRLEDGSYEFAEEGDRGAMGIRFLPAEGQLESIETEIPRPWVMERGPRVFALVFMLQGWTRWEVFDPQLGDTLQREAVLQGLVAMRQAQMEKEGARVPLPVVEGDESGASSSSGSRRKRWRWW